MAERIFLTTDSVGGVWQYTLDLAGEYASRNVAVDLVVLGPASAARLREATAIPGVEVLEPGLPLDWTASSPAEMEDASVELARLARRRGARIVHLNSAGLACSRRWPAPVVVTLHSCVASWWRTVKRHEVPPDEFVWRTTLVAEALRNADAVIVPSHSFAALAASIYGRDLPWAPIHNGRHKPSQGRGRDDRGGILSCGRLWDEGKNMAALDAVAAQLSRQVRVAGSTHNPNGGDVSFSSIRLLGELPSDDLRARLAEGSIFVSTALYEPFGLGALEAAQAGCALVLSDIPTFRELWGDAAFFVDPSDPAGIADVLEHLSRSPEECAAWGRRAECRAEKYTSTAMAAETLSLYTRLLTRSQVAGVA